MRELGGGGTLLLTDLYELRMAASYLRRGMDGQATFSLFARRLPPERGFLVAAGLDDCLRFLESAHVGRGDRAYLRSIPGFTPEDTRALAGLRFTGDVWAVPEGTVVFENEPLLELTAPIAEAQVVETYLLNQITYQTAIATKAARCRIAARGRPVVDFAFRRTHGVEAGIAVARASAIAGFSATSNVAAAQRYGLATSGTMAHSYVEAFAREKEAFAAFVEDFPEHPVLLVDTYETQEGVRNAIQTAQDHGLGSAFSVRLDSGDFNVLSRAARRLLDEAGCTEAGIVVSGGLDEYDIDNLVRSGAPIDAFGVGTRMGVSADAPSLDSVYKLVAYEGRPVLKLSSGKSTLPGAKQVFRSLEHGGDVLGLRTEVLPDREPLLVPVMIAGRRVADAESVATMSARLTLGIDALPPGALRIEHPEPVPVSLSPELERLRDRCVEEARSHTSAPVWPAVGIETADDPRIVACTTDVTTHNGNRVRIRPIVIADQDAIVRGFRQLSDESRRHRFLIPPAELSESMLAYLTRVDYTNHVALAAFALDDAGEPGVGIARYIRLADEPDCAEAAVTVLDEYQNRGIGTVLLEALALIAQQNGITRFCGYVQWENTGVVELARRLGATVRHSSTGLARYDVPLARVARQVGESPLRLVLRSLAQRELGLVNGADAAPVGAPVASGRH